MYTTNSFFRYIESTSKRLDQHYLNPIWDNRINKMKGKNFVPLKEYLAYGMQSGITPKNDQKYLTELAPADSINYIQIGSIDWKGNILNETDYKVDKQVLEVLEDHQIIRENDILFAATGATIGKVVMYKMEEPSVACGDLIIARMKDERLSEIIHFFMLTDYGKEQIIRHIFGSTNGHIKIQDIENILVPKLRPELIDSFKEVIIPLKDEYFNTKKMAKKILVEIDSIIFEELGWEVCFDKLPISDYSHSFFRYPSQVESRLDTLFNDVVFDKLFEKMKKSEYDFCNLSKYVNLRLELRNPQNKPEQYFEYVDIGNIDTTYGQANPISMQGSEATSSRIRQVMHENDILVSTTRPTRRAIAMVPKNLDNQICSTGFAVLTPKKGVCGEFLFHILRTEIVTAQFERLCSGSGYPAINKEKDVLRILVPDVDLPKQRNILSNIKPKLDLAKNLEEKAEKKWIKAKEKFEEIIISD